MVSQTKDLRQRALEYLAKREYSSAELACKLKAYAEETDDIAGLLNDFKQRGWLSDARFTEQLVHARKAKFGSVRVAHELREKGVDEGLIVSAIETVKRNELDNAKAVWAKKFKSLPSSREAWAKQARFLQGRGFGLDIIKQILNRSDEDLN